MIGLTHLFHTHQVTIITVACNNDFRKPEELEAMNKNRQGSLLDFIDDFVKEFPKSIKQYDANMTRMY
jgi:hypothetical protein